MFGRMLDSNHDNLPVLLLLLLQPAPLHSGDEKQWYPAELGQFLQNPATRPACNQSNLSKHSGSQSANQNHRIRTGRLKQGQCPVQNRGCFILSGRQSFAPELQARQRAEPRWGLHKIDRDGHDPDGHRLKPPANSNRPPLNNNNSLHSLNQQNRLVLGSLHRNMLLKRYFLPNAEIFLD